MAAIGLKLRKRRKTVHLPHQKWAEAEVYWPDLLDVLKISEGIDKSVSIPLLILTFNWVRSKLIRVKCLSICVQDLQHDNLLSGELVLAQTMLHMFYYLLKNSSF